MVDWAGFAQLRQQNQEQNNPLNKFAQGYQIGAAINAQRQQQQANEAKMKRQQEMEGDFTRIYENYSGNPAEQAKELGRLSFKYPEIADKLDKQAASLDEKVKQGLVNDILPAYNAILTGNKDVAMQQLRTRAEAYNNAGDKANYERFNNFANSLENSTDLSQQVMTGGMYLAGIMGTKDFMGAIEKIPKTAQEFANMPLEQRQTLAKTLQEEEKAKQGGFETAIKSEQAKQAPFDTQKAAVAAKFAESKAVSDLEKAGWDIKKLQADMDIARQNVAIAAQNAKTSRMNAGASAEANQLKLQELMQKREQTLRDKTAEIESARYNMDNMLNTAQKIINTPISVIENATGPLDVRLPTARQSTADFEALIENLGSQAFLAQIPNIKGMGALSNAEGEKLQQALQNFSLKQSPKQLINSIKEAQRLTLKARKNISDKYGVPDTAPDVPATITQKTTIDFRSLK